jgi:dephospho-CoA kinase
MARLKARGWSAEQIEQRIRAQMPTEEKIVRSNYVIWTDGPLDVHAAQLDLILRSK